MQVFVSFSHQILIIQFSPFLIEHFVEVLENQGMTTVRPATALTSLALNLILYYFELVPELLLQHYFLRFYLPSTTLF